MAGHFDVGKQFMRRGRGTLILAGNKGKTTARPVRSSQVAWTDPASAQYVRFPVLRDKS